MIGRDKDGVKHASDAQSIPSLEVYDHAIEETWDRVVQHSHSLRLIQAKSISTDGKHSEQC